MYLSIFYLYLIIYATLFQFGSANYIIKNLRNLPDLKRPCYQEIKDQVKILLGTDLYDEKDINKILPLLNNRIDHFKEIIPSKSFEIIKNTLMNPDQLSDRIFQLTPQIRKGSLRRNLQDGKDLKDIGCQTLMAIGFTSILIFATIGHMKLAQCCRLRESYPPVSGLIVHVPFMLINGTLGSLIAACINELFDIPGNQITLTIFSILAASPSFYILLKQFNNFEIDSEREDDSTVTNESHRGDIDDSKLEMVEIEFNA